MYLDNSPLRVGDGQANQEPAVHIHQRVNLTGRGRKSKVATKETATLQVNGRH